MPFFLAPQLRPWHEIKKKIPDIKSVHKFL